MNYLTTKGYSSLLSDIFFRDMFVEDFFSPLPSLKKINYPIDMFQTNDGLHIDIAAIGLEKSDIKIDIKDNILKVSYKNPSKNPTTGYAYCGITKKDFDLAWQINEKFNINQTTAELDKGLLKIFIPIATEKKVKEISVQIK